MSNNNNEWDEAVEQFKNFISSYVYNYAEASMTHPWVLEEALRHIADELEEEGHRLNEEIDTDDEFKSLVKFNGGSDTE